MLGRPRAKLYGVAVNDADYPVNWTDESGKAARCPIFSAWKKRKHELAIRLAELQADSRVAEALRVRYL